jgi:hypothetical protein
LFPAKGYRVYLFFLPGRKNMFFISGNYGHLEAQRHIGTEAQRHRGKILKNRSKPPFGVVYNVF